MFRRSDSIRKSRLASTAAFLVLGAVALAGGCKEETTTTSTTSPSSTSGGGGGAVKGLTVGFSQVGAESAWRTAETNSVRSEAESRGVDLKFSDAQQKQENQIKALRSFVAQGVDAIILAPKVETGWDQVLKEIKQADIPVILVDRGVTADESLYTAFIAADFIAEGRMAAEWLAKKTGGKASIAELQGTSGAAPAIDRGKGFAEAIAKHPEMKVIKSQDGDFSRSKGKEVMEAFLKSPEGPQINAVYAHNDEMALGAIQAIEAAGKKPGTDIIVISIDGGRDAFQAMVDGKLNSTIECNPLLGPAAFDAVAKAVKAEPQPKKTIVPSTLYEQSQAKDSIGSRKY